MAVPVAVKRLVDVAMFGFAVLLVASMLRLTFTLDTWQFRTLAGCSAVVVTYLLVQVAALGTRK